MRLSATIMAHPERRDDVADLLDLLDRPLEVYWDPHGPPSGKADRVWSVAREVWLRHDPDADWHALIQDDAVPSLDLLASLEKALEHVPVPAIVSPYLGQGARVPVRWERIARAADARGASWVRSDRVMWGVCLIAPVSLIPHMVEWCDRKAGMPDDMRVAAYARRHGLDVWYPWPSLVDHKTIPSLTKHRATDRTARRHHVGSALSLSWDGPVVSDPMTLRRRPPRSGPHRTGMAP